LSDNAAKREKSRRKWGDLGALGPGKHGLSGQGCRIKKKGVRVKEMGTAARGAPAPKVGGMKFKEGRKVGIVQTSAKS